MSHKFILYYNFLAIVLFVSGVYSFGQCSDYDSCEDCLQQNEYLQCGWCADHNGTRCAPGTVQGPDSGTCKYWEYHPINPLMATSCCFPNYHSCRECVMTSPQSGWCHWCADDNVCMPRDDWTSHECLGVTDRGSCCTDFNGCKDCIGSDPCSWCLEMNRCVESTEPKCDNTTQKCCGTTDCLECFNFTHIDVASPPCVYCPSQKQCIYATDKDSCPHFNSFGPEYCNDHCYQKSSCGECTKDIRCIWVDKANWLASLHPIDESFCISGSPFGPVRDNVHWMQIFYYTPVVYHYGTCLVPGVAVAVGLVVLGVFAAITPCVCVCGLACVNAARLARKIRRAEKKEKGKIATVYASIDEYNDVLGDDEDELGQREAIEAISYQEDESWE